MDRRTRLRLGALVILALGLASALGIYLAADDAPASAALAEMRGSKPYVRQLERFGGKASVLFDQFNRWFAGLWEGRQLGITVAWITSVLAGGHLHRRTAFLRILVQRTAMQSTSMSNGPGKAPTQRKMRTGEPAGK